MVYVTADIHGNFENFTKILKLIDLKPEDDLYILGDAIDRFPDGIKILQKIISTPNMHMLLGNHEFMMLDALHHPDDLFASTIWFQNGGALTAAALTSLPRGEADQIIDFVESLPLNIPIEVNGRKFLLVHAGIELTDENTPNGYGNAHSYAGHMGYHSPAEYTVWNRDLYTAALTDKIQCDGATVICGHTPTECYDESCMMKIRELDGLINIDCGCGWGRENGGRLACLRLDDMKTFYSE